VIGLDRVKGLRQAIFAANHCSELDPILVTAALPWLGRFAPFFYVVAPVEAFSNKEKKARYGWRQRLYTSGWFFHAWGAYPNVPGHRDYATSLQNTIAVMRDGGSMCMFPEGKLSKTGTIQEARGGVAYLSHATDVPVVPVAIIGSFRMSAKVFFNRQRTIKVVFGEPVFARECMPQDAPSVDDFHVTAQEYMRRVSILMDAFQTGPQSVGVRERLVVEAAQGRRGNLYM